MRKNILVTGLPHSGKSTLLKEVVSEIKNRVGFLTSEILKNGVRVGFEMVTKNGDKELLASTEINTNYPVSKYFVDIGNLDSIVANVSEYSDVDVLYIDEIGQMELFSDNFKSLCKKYLDSENVSLFTVSKVYTDGFIESVKKRDDVIVVDIDENNRNEKKEFVKLLIKKIIKAKKYVTEKRLFTKKSNTITLNSEHGTRKISITGNNLVCDCDFYNKYAICSHVLATEELFVKSKSS